MDDDANQVSIGLMRPGTRCTAVVGWALLSLACQIGPRDVEGKRCGTDDPCPSPHRCAVTAADGEARCTLHFEGLPVFGCSSPLLFEDFQAFSAGTTWAQGAIRAQWRADYQDTEIASVQLEGQDNKVLETGRFATLVTVPSVGDLDLVARLKTVVSPVAPQTYDVAWVMWHFQDPTRFYQLVLKTDGWHIEKRYPSGSTFPASGEAAVFPEQTWHDVRIRQVGSVVTVVANGVELTSFTDSSAPLRQRSCRLQRRHDGQVR
jgi:hypothetical protein